jgi:hypothetical protein
MPRPDAFDVVMRLSGMPRSAVVDALRRVHRGDVRPADLWSLLETGTPTPDQPAGPTPAAVAAPVAPPFPDYDRVRRHFVQDSQRLRNQALLTERLLDGFAGISRMAPLQHELRIRCEAGHRAGARFVLVNSLDHAVRVTFRRGRVHASADETSSVRVAFDPEHPWMDAHEEREIRVSVDLPASIQAPHLDLGIDVLGNERLLIKVWLRLELQAGSAR